MSVRSRRYCDDVAPLVDAVLSGKVLTYGDVAELSGWGAARAVGMVMSRHGHELPWWRVVRAEPVERVLDLTAEQVRDLVGMGPSARHVDVAALPALAGRVTLSVRVAAYEVD